MTTPRASVVVTNHNYEAFVGDAIESALGQRGGGVQVVVVDDGSTDDSPERLAEFGDRVEVVVQPNLGQGAAMNAGWERCTGPIVIFLDADDLLDPDVVDRVESALARDPELARVQYPLRVIDAQGTPTGELVPPEPSRLARGDVRRRLAASPDDLLWQPTSGNAFRARTLRQILPMPVQPYVVCADYYLSNLSGLHGTVAVLDSPGGSYRVHGLNRHYARIWSLATMRTNLERTSATHRYLAAECTRVGCRTLPEQVLSVSFLGQRLVSLRVDRTSHPIMGDSVRRLCWLGVRAAIGRHDVRPVRRAAMAGWFLITAIAPAASVARLARPIVRLERGRP